MHAVVSLFSQIVQIQSTEPSLGGVADRYILEVIALSLQFVHSGLLEAMIVQLSLRPLFTSFSPRPLFLVVLTGTEECKVSQPFHRALGSHVCFIAMFTQHLSMQSTIYIESICINNVSKRTARRCCINHDCISTPAQNHNFGGSFNDVFLSYFIRSS